ncbi:hypothetical protein Vretifemale_5662 [Volvox reticuliferus]|uniref:GPI mannosyltransferase 2 n=1 Tax=Volvox reticuliferus TaxID=1737510 RepID=A0A8J4FLR8_9CHLO|nr:hypothetical protein Vretifemale_5662 [Volvox reticuliferus]
MGMLRPEEIRIALLAACVRGTVVLLTTALDWVLPDYDTSKFISSHFVKPFNLDRASELSLYESRANSVVWGPLSSHRALEGLPSKLAHLLQGWLVWDAVFFADIAASGYSFEQYYAFFPFLPGTRKAKRDEPEKKPQILSFLLSLMLVSLIHATLNRLPYLRATSAPLFIYLAITAWAPARFFPVLALTINAAASVISTLLLYRLGERLTHDRQLAALACLFFMFNPATIFHAAPYSEACFTAATLAALYWLHCRDRLVPAMAAVAVSCGLRSNGVVNAGYLGHYCICRGVAAWSASKLGAVGHMLLGVLAAGIAVMPLVAFQYSAYSTFCRGFMDPEVVSEKAVHPTCTLKSRWPRPWCASRLPYVYGFIQSEYWNVGLFRYWTLQQLPNFLLAAPVLLLSAAGLAEYCKANSKHVLLRLGLTPLAQQPPPLPRMTPNDNDVAPRHIAGDPGAPKMSGLGYKAITASETGPQTRELEGTGLRQRWRVQAPERPGPGQPGLRHESARAPTCTAPLALEPTQDVAIQDDSKPDGGRGEKATAAGGGNSGDAVSGYLSPELAVFMYPWAFSLLIAVTTMHVQVSTRFLLSACPPLYWYMAHIWLKRGHWTGMEEATGEWPKKRKPGQAGAGWCGDARSSIHVDGSGWADVRPEGYGVDCGKEWGEGKWEQRSASAGGGLAVVREGESVVSVSGCNEDGGVQQPVGAGEAGSGWCAVGLWRWCLTYMMVGCVLFINFYPWT